MRKNSFTLIELLVAVGVMMIVSSALAYTYTQTAKVASGQMATAEMHARAVHLLDELSIDMKGIRLTDNDPGRIQMMGSFLNNGTKKIGSQGMPYLTFINAFTNLDYDLELLDKDVPGGGIYDGGVNGDGNFKTSEGLKEVSYYSIYNEKSGFFDVYRAIRSPINSSKSLADNDQAQLFDRKYKGNYRLAENVIYMGFVFWDGGAERDTHNNLNFPILVDVTLSTAATTGPAQWEGTLQSGSGGNKLVVKKDNGAFPADSNGEDAIGYILIDNGKSQNVFQYDKVKKADDIYTFTSNGGNGKAGGLPAPSFQVGDPVIIGQTFKRSFNLR